MDSIVDQGKAAAEPERPGLVVTEQIEAVHHTGSYR